MYGFFGNKTILVYTNHVVFERRFPAVSRHTFDSHTTFEALQTIVWINHGGFDGSQFGVFVSPDFRQAAMEGLRPVSTSIIVSAIKSATILVLFKSTTSIQN